MFRFTRLNAVLALLVVASLLSLSFVVGTSVLAQPSGVTHMMQPSLALATATDREGVSYIITVHDVVHEGAPNVVLVTGSQPSLRTNGREYAAVDNGDIFVGIPEPGVKIFLTEDGQDVIDSDPAFGSNGHIAYKHGDQVLIRLHSGETVAMTYPDGSAIRVGEANLAWSMDGRYLAFADELGDIYAYEPETQGLTLLAQFNGVEEIDWNGLMAITTRDGDAGRIRVFAPFYERTEILDVDFSGKQEHPTVNYEGQLAFVSWSPDFTNSEIMILDPSAWLGWYRVSEEQLKEMTQITRVPQKGSVMIEPAWWSDEVLLFVSDEDKNGDAALLDLEIYSFDLTTSQVAWETMLTSTPGLLQHSPSGTATSRSSLNEYFWSRWHTLTVPFEHPQ